MTTSYYSTCKYPLSALARYTLLEVLNVFSLCSNGMSVVPTNGSPLVPPTFNKPPPAPRQTCQPHMDQLLACHLDIYCTIPDD